MAPQCLSEALSNIMEMGWKWRERKKYTITRNKEGTKDRRPKKKLLLDYISVKIPMMCYLDDLLSIQALMRLLLGDNPLLES